MNVPHADGVASPSTLSSRVDTAASPLRAHTGEPPPSGLPSQPLVVSSHSTHAHSIAVSDSGNEGGLVASWTSSHVDGDFVHEATTPPRRISGRLPQQRPTSTGSALLCFRYRVIPWINGAPAFGSATMTLAGSSKVISDCIFYCMRSRDDHIGTPGVMSSDSNTRRRLLDQLSAEAPLEADVGRTLIAMSDIFCTPPSEWASSLAPPVRCCAEEISRNPTSSLVTEPLKTLLRLHLKIGKALPSLAQCQCC